jgi:ABC-2 type transport system ATP-binding protein
LLNFIYPTSGKAFIFGKDIVKHSIEIRRLVGYLPSEVHYYDDMRAADLLSYSMRFYGKPDAERMKRLAGRLHLDLHRKIEDLSFGNRKKVGIVQALLHRPKLIILDEPTNGLDPLMQNTFFEMIREEQQAGATIFFSSHMLGEVQKLCNRVAIIKEGRLVNVESMRNLIGSRFKKVTLTLEDPERLELPLQGVMNRTAAGQTLSFLFNGDLQQLLQCLSAAQLTDLRIEEPDLEEIFLHYYQS